ncbi:hypothetical protein [Schlesneria paludicola]|uniref:hypothetical protein n=1 Tax=Schlesneria paludicola TaxID=360056 RepID=UPI0012F79E47|nr:hypothetical protein [Schlesneria paludicola]
MTENRLKASHARGGSTMKAVLITLVVVCGGGFLLCAGLGVAGYIWLQRSFAHLHMTDPTQVRELTAEIVEIELPRELQPKNAISFLGTRIISYHWCPSGTCNDEDASELALVSIPNSKDGNGIHFEVDTTFDDTIDERFIHYTRTVQEFEIRGKAYPFTFVFGEAKPAPAERTTDDDVEDMESKSSEQASSDVDANQPIAIPSDSPATAASTTEPIDTALPTTTGGQKTWWIHGEFPGKKGRCKLDLQLNADEYDEAKIHAMLRSIR